MIYWLLKLSQRPIQQIKNAVWDFYRQQNQELEMLRKQLSSMPVTDYFTLVKNDHQINLARHNQKTQQLQFLNSLLPEVHNTPSYYSWSKTQGFKNASVVIESKLNPHLEYFLRGVTVLLYNFISRMKAEPRFGL